MVVSLFSAADGVVEAPEKFMHNWDDAMAEDLQDQLSTWEASLLGRHQYDDWATYWPSYEGADDDAFARKINSVRKYVVTSTPLDPHWEAAEVLGDPKAPLAERVAPLRTADIAGDIMVGGSMTLATSLLREDLVDEVRLLITPYVVGSGHRLFDSVTDKALDLISAKTTPTGSVLVRYRVSAD
ncbi:dihydrofolate reductase family protein [Solicola gregarius]|uniref:Dihydrofolate reductase family protein n=1 Tax=Solicola gregarius TaxID=2908642 RepID=A0AA46TMH0_9ACTN|nr:dihydrofolate reductase family protein [Solicola gregarius]UYM07848.1 dihydrofolate reductase family protein [Solicola gregarius]